MLALVGAHLLSWCVCGCDWPLNLDIQLMAGPSGAAPLRDEPAVVAAPVAAGGYG